jgi:hypothetical protein
METRDNIEKEVDKALTAMKNTNAVEVPSYYVERTMQRIGLAKPEYNSGRYAVLKVAAVIILICINAYTISRLVESPAQQPEVQTKVSIDDLVSDYQVTDISSTDWLNNKTNQNEQP